MRFTIEEKRIRKFEIRIIEVASDPVDAVARQLQAQQVGFIQSHDPGRIATPADIAAALAENRALRLHVLGLLGIKEPESE